ncbi:hypothetical protein ACLMJK_004137 [Lecanora helva]
MMTITNAQAGLEDIEQTSLHVYALKRWYTPLPTVHGAGMRLLLSISVFLGTVVVTGPSSSAPPTSGIVQDIIKYGRPNGVLLPPALIDQMCLDSAGLAALRSLDHVHYIGSPLGKVTGQKLIPYVKVTPAIGSIESGSYFIELNSQPEDWDYVSFHPKAGAEFEQRLGNLHELVFVRQPENSFVPQIFLVHRDKNRFETKDLWIKHPRRKGLWKIVGCTDDYITFSHAEGLHASSLEPIIESHELVKAVLIGGHGRPKPVLIVELIPGTGAKAENEMEQKDLLDSLQPYLDRVNEQCHTSVHLSKDLVLFAKKDKPFQRIIKESVARLQTLQLYEDEIESLYAASAKASF